ncbi:MAG: CBS domain-containing protein [Thermoanaerobaculia bacterium]
MRVGDVMLTRPRFCRVDETLADAGRRMAQVGAGVLPVVGEDATVVGMLTDRDICCNLARLDRRPGRVTVAEIAGPTVWACAATDDIASALATMREHKVRRLPVIDGRGALEGLLSLDDIVLHAQIFETREFHGPYYTDVVETLKAIVGHTPPALAAGSAS